MNVEALRIFQLKRTVRAVVGRPFIEVLAKHPDIIRVLHSAFELSHLPNRAELRLRSTGKVIGYTLSHVKDDRGRSEGVVIFFKDLTKVEQMEIKVEEYRKKAAGLGGLFGSGGKKADAMYALLLENEALEEALEAQYAAPIPPEVEREMAAWHRIQDAAAIDMITRRE